MPREKRADKKARAAAIEERMYEHYGEGACSLDHTTPFQLTCAVVLSAQCTDAAVNKVTPELFALYGTPEAMAAASVEDIERIIHPLGFFRSKARNLVKLGRMVVSDFGGEIPNDMELLQKNLTRQLDKLLARPKKLENEYFSEYRKYCFNCPEEIITVQEE